MAAFILNTAKIRKLARFQPILESETENQKIVNQLLTELTCSKLRDEVKNLQIFVYISRALSMIDYRIKEHCLSKHPKQLLSFHPK